MLEQEGNMRKLAEEKAKKLAEKEASLIKYFIFLPTVAIAILIVVLTPYREPQIAALVLGIPSLGLILGYIAYNITKSNAYTKFYEEELRKLQKTR